MGLASRKMQEVRSIPHIETVLQTNGGVTNGSTVGDQQRPGYDNIVALAFHLTGSHVQLIRNKSAEACDQEA